MRTAATRFESNTEGETLGCRKGLQAIESEGEINLALVNRAAGKNAGEDAGMAGRRPALRHAQEQALGTITNYPISSW